MAIGSCWTAAVSRNVLTFAIQSRLRENFQGRNEQQISNIFKKIRYHSVADTVLRGTIEQTRRSTLVRRRIGSSSSLGLKYAVWKCQNSFRRGHHLKRSRYHPSKKWDDVEHQTLLHTQTPEITRIMMAKCQEYEVVVLLSEYMNIADSEKIFKTLAKITRQHGLHKIYVVSSPGFFSLHLPTSLGLHSCFFLFFCW